MTGPVALRWRELLLGGAGAAELATCTDRSQLVAYALGNTRYVLCIATIAAPARQLGGGGAPS